MTDFYQLSRQASGLRKERQHDQALPVYRELWEQHRDQCSEWEGWGYAFCLRKLRRSQEALEICRQALPLNPQMAHLRGLLGWCLYDTEIKRPPEEIARNEGRYFGAVNEILELTEPGQYSPYVRTLLQVIDYLKSKASSPAEGILHWTAKVSADQLSDQPGRGRDETGKLREYASDREKWYAERCKALCEAGRFQECIDLATAALGEFSKFHHDNDVWLRWRMAAAQAGLGDKQAAIDLLQSLLIRKKDWFIYRDLAQYQFDLRQTDEALSHAIEAALAPGELGFKWELFLLMGQILQAQGKPEQAKKHVLLAAKVRDDEWRVPAALSQAAQQMGVELGAPVAAGELHRELRRFWQSEKLADMPRGEGEISNLLSNGKAGFIRSDSGEDYYFKLSSFQGPRHLQQVGQRVAFHIERNPRPDQRDIAIHVKPMGHESAPEDQAI